MERAVSLLDRFGRGLSHTGILWVGLRRDRSGYRVLLDTCFVARFERDRSRADYVEAKLSAVKTHSGETRIARKPGPNPPFFAKNSRSGPLYDAVPERRVSGAGPDRSDRGIA